MTMADNVSNELNYWAKMEATKRNLSSIVGDRFIYHLGTDTWGNEIVLMEKRGAAMARIYWYKDECSTVYLDWLSVSSDFRNHGVGTELQNIREKIGKSLGATCSKLLVEKSTWMHNWYKRRGYEDLEDYNDEWIWMKKELL